jgi:hypothetical protein
LLSYLERCNFADVHFGLAPLAWYQLPLSGAANKGRFSSDFAPLFVPHEDHFSMADSDNYKAIRDVIKGTPAKAIKAKYKAQTDVRKLWPHVLGHNPGEGSDPPVEVALCLELALDENGKVIRKFRCFKIETDLHIIGDPIANPWPDGFPKPMTFRQARKQSSVDDVDVYR